MIVTDASCGVPDGAGGGSNGAGGGDSRRTFEAMANPRGAWLVDERAVWLRTVKVHDILVAYRVRYTPKTGSPAIDAGDPGTNGTGNDIGAIGAGVVNASDRFGL